MVSIEGKLGVLKQVEPRDLWPHEAADLTPWLAEHLGILGAALGADLELTQREADVGDFALDLLAKDLGTGRSVIIENQLAATDHDHLGKLITYAAGFEAATIVWVAPVLRDEHRQALEWLNARTDQETSFFGVVLEVVQIDESRPAVNLRVAVAPHDWSKGAPRPRPASGRGELYRGFFQELIDQLREEHRFTNARLGQPQSWYAFAAERRGVKYSAAFASSNRVRVEVYIDGGERDENKRLFDALAAKKAELEKALQAELVWERLDGKQAARVSLVRDGSILDTEDRLREYRQWLVRHLVAFRAVFGPLLRDDRFGTP